ncbi:MAG: hypothetical protein LBD41_07420 [Clostridiales Family XIII bacterium]|nr:hypothetical protein [Clostridiales Family XIII bacterium]
MKIEKPKETKKDANLVISELEVNDYPNVLFYSNNQCILCGKTKDLIVFRDRRICKKCIELITKVE